MNDLQKQAREIAARHGIKAYEPPAETGKQEPGCECPARKKCPESYCANGCDWAGTDDFLVDDADGLAPHCPKCASNSAILSIPEEIQRVVTNFYSDPCSCEQSRAEYDRLGLSYVVLEGQYECAVQIIREERPERDRLNAECEQLRSDLLSLNARRALEQSRWEAREIALQAELAERDRLRTELLATRTDKAFMERKGQEAAIELAAARSLLEEAREALNALPLKDFDKDVDTIDAAEFVDHSADFMDAMSLARAVLAKIEASVKPEVKE